MDELITQYIPKFLDQVRFKDRGDIVKRELYNRLGLIKNRAYIVMESKQYSQRTDLYLIGYPGIPFDYTMFQLIQEDI